MKKKIVSNPQFQFYSETKTKRKKKNKIKDVFWRQGRRAGMVSYSNWSHLLTYHSSWVASWWILYKVIDQNALLSFWHGASWFRFLINIIQFFQYFFIVANNWKLVSNHLKIKRLIFFVTEKGLAPFWSLIMLLRASFPLLSPLPSNRWSLFQVWCPLVAVKWLATTRNTVYGYHSHLVGERTALSQPAEFHVSWMWVRSMASSEQWPSQGNGVCCHQHRIPGEE